MARRVLDAGEAQMRGDAIRIARLKPFPNIVTRRALAARCNTTIGVIADLERGTGGRCSEKVLAALETTLNVRLREPDIGRPKRVGFVVGNAIRKARLGFWPRALTRGDLAAMCSTTVNSIADHERGVAAYDPKMLSAMEVVLNVGLRGSEVGKPIAVGKEVGSAIREAREAMQPRFMTRMELAVKCDIHLSVVMGFERGTALPDEKVDSGEETVLSAMERVLSVKLHGSDIGASTFDGRRQVRRSG